MISYFLHLLSAFDYLRLRRNSKVQINLISRNEYASRLRWFGVPIFQVPTDLFLYMKLIWESKPTLVIETGVAKGGSLLFACQMLDLIYGADGRERWRVIGCDVNSLDQARDVVERFDYLNNVSFFQGDSASKDFRSFIETTISDYNSSRVLLSLDSNHTEEHVLAELNSLSHFVTIDSFIVVWDTRIGDLTRLTHLLRPRSWSRKKHAGTGVEKFMQNEGGLLGFIVESSMENELIFTGVKRGILKRLIRA